MTSIESLPLFPDPSIWVARMVFIPSPEEKVIDVEKLPVMQAVERGV